MNVEKLIRDSNKYWLSIPKNERMEVSLLFSMSMFEIHISIDSGKQYDMEESFN